ncbi:hypothetical protein GALL_438850 [mine drainage metagenome]|uniref:Uncharacterized protein n=1 Tax=mine drainage metagenome TaxID=410659 RepID=A0A1J5PUD6_9ZZZZ
MDAPLAVVLLVRLSSSVVLITSVIALPVATEADPVESSEPAAAIGTIVPAKPAPWLSVRLDPSSDFDWLELSLASPLPACLLPVEFSFPWPSPFMPPSFPLLSLAPPLPLPFKGAVAVENGKPGTSLGAAPGVASAVCPGRVSMVNTLPPTVVLRVCPPNRVRTAVPSVSLWPTSAPEPRMPIVATAVSIL